MKSNVNLNGSKRSNNQSANQLLSSRRRAAKVLGGIHTKATAAPTREKQKLAQPSTH